MNSCSYAEFRSLWLSWKYQHINFFVSGFMAFLSERSEMLLTLTETSKTAKPDRWMQDC